MNVLQSADDSKHHSSITIMTDGCTKFRKFPSRNPAEREEDQEYVDRFLCSAPRSRR